MACARQSSPSGGPVDTDPPQIIATDPPAFSTHYTASGFELYFDEYVQVKDMGTQLIVSPPLKSSTDYSLRGKRIIISWKDTLQPNTTYQFNFGKAIVDANEGNVNSNLVYVFSTGDYIDSLSISGKVIQSLDNQPLPQAFAMIYKKNLDSLPQTVRPDYFALTDSNGYFLINYLPEGDFKIFSLREENNNYIYNGPPEQIAFLDHTVKSALDDTTGQHLMASFIEKDTTQYIKSQKGTDYGYYELVFNKPAVNPSITFADSETDQKLEAINYLNLGKDSLQSWVKFPKRDNFEEVTVYINDDTTLVDTAFWYLETNSRYKEKAKLVISSNTNRNKLDLEKTFSLQFNNPLVEVDTSLVYFLEDSVQVYPKQFKRLQLNRRIDVYYPFNPTSKYIFKAKAGAFKDIFESYSDSISIPFSLQDNEYYGSLKVKVSLKDSAEFSENHILRLLTEKNKIIAEKYFTEGISTHFEKLTPGLYRLEVIFDKNNNGEWDTGEYRNQLQPEKLSYYPDKIEVRSNWDFEIDWTPATPFD